MQSLEQNQWLNSEVMHVIFDHVAATRSYSRLSLHCYKARVIRISFGKSNLKFIYCRHRFSIIVYLKERLIICLDSFCKTKKVVMFERVFFFIINGSSRSQEQRVNIISTKRFATQSHILVCKWSNGYGGWAK